MQAHQCGACGKGSFERVGARRFQGRVPHRSEGGGAICGCRIGGAGWLYLRIAPSRPAAAHPVQDEESLTDEERAALRAERQRAAQEHAEFEAHKKGILKLRADRARAQRIRDAERRRAASGRDSFEFLS